MPLPSRLNHRFWPSCSRIAVLLAVALIALALVTPASGQRRKPERVDLRVKPSDNQPTQADKDETTRADRIGLTAAKRRLGLSIANGAGVVIGHVEGGDDKYLPNMTQARFKAIQFKPRSGESKPFGHANTSARFMYGSDSFAPGIRQVHNFATSHWLGQGYLRTGTGQSPADEPIDLFNHSWIANPGKEKAVPVLRRVDYQIDQRGILMCVGVNNGQKSKVPQMLASAYNVIAVGAANGESSGGYTTIEGKGRCKPELIAPHGLTSFATPIVSACAARLREVGQKRAKDQPNATAAAHADRPEVIKAALLAGATKPDDWKPEPGKPLDAHYGAGMVNINHSLEIMNANPTAPGQLKRSSGWDYRPIKATQTRQYSFTIDRPLSRLSLAMTWHRKVDGKTGRFRFGNGEPRQWSYATGLANFNMTLIRLTPSGKPKTLATSKSDIDNVEHIFQNNLPSGRDRIRISRVADGLLGPWPYAVAWRMERH